MNNVTKGLGKVQVQLKWDPSPIGAPASDLDIVAATYAAADPHGTPAYLVHFDSRSPDGTITLDRDSKTGKGLGFDEVMTLELDRLAPSYGRVVVGIVVQQHGGRLTFGDVAGTGVRVVASHTDLAASDLGEVAAATAATVGEFRRGEAGEWRFRPGVRGFDAEPAAFARVMGGGAS
ncbi:TerD family protein [Streptomyces sp. NPDC026673]|uniref:TerD family protein n=1 Tax=Streptomyces sp. NPDC026673 TaxID=3155724 RepID=UPI0033E3DF6F